jgi:dTDP-4-amino-4,6-dideoxygalactose transaminase
MLIPQQKLTAQISDLVGSGNLDTAEYIPGDFKWIGSGRAGLSHILRSIKARKVGVSSFTCHVVDSAIRLHCKPVYIDSGAIMTIDCIKSKIKDVDALVVPHNFGFMGDMEAIHSLCKKHEVTLIEDCAQALGSKFNGKLAGSFGNYSFFSFGISKNIGFCGGAVLGDLPSPKYTSYPLIKLGILVAKVIAAPLIFNKHFYPIFFKQFQKELDKQQSKLEFTMSSYARRVVMAQFKRYNQILATRSNNAELCISELDDVADFIRPIQGNDPAWLYFVLSTKNRAEKRKRLLKEGVDIQELKTFTDISGSGKKAGNIRDGHMAFALNRPRTEIDYIIKKIKKVWANG